MAVVAIVALDCDTIMAIGRRTEAFTGFISLIAVACLPMLHVLAVGLGLMVRDRGRRRPFLVGFEVAGWLAIAATMIWCDPLLAGLERIMESAGFPSGTVQPSGLQLVLG